MAGSFGASNAFVLAAASLRLGSGPAAADEEEAGEAEDGQGVGFGDEVGVVVSGMGQ